jgi:NADP-dependent 3-hydroxy acid dehydrogenase YdfG
MEVSSSRTAFSIITQGIVLDVSGAVPIVTGASSGIGLATTRLLASRGAYVALVARSADALAQSAQELPEALVVPTDVRDPDAMCQMVSTVKDHCGRIDILINNAGQGMHVPGEQASLADYRSLLELNVVGLLATMQAVIPIMRAQGGGQMINISSGTSKIIWPNLGPYASTKYALNALTLTARLELAPDNIRVGVVYPGITATNLMRNAVASDAPQPASRRDAMPMDTPESVAAKILTPVESEAAKIYADSSAQKTEG